MFSEKAPYLITLFVASLAWTIVHFVNRIIEAPTIEFSTSKVLVPGESPSTYQYDVLITNLSTTSTFRDAEFTVVAGPNARIQFSKDGRHTTIRVRPPVSGANTEAKADVTGAAFRIPVFPPNSQFVLVTRFTGEGEPVFAGRPPQGGSESFWLVQSSLQTFLAKHEFAAFMIALLIWLGLIILWACTSRAT